MSELQFFRSSLRWFVGCALLFFVAVEVFGIFNVLYMSREAELSPWITVVSGGLGIMNWLLLPVVYLAAFAFRGRHRWAAQLVFWIQLIEIAAGFYICTKVANDLGFRELLKGLNFLPMLLHQSPFFRYCCLVNNVIKGVLLAGIAFVFWRTPPEWSTLKGPWLTWGVAKGNLFGLLRHGGAAALSFGLIFHSLLLLVVEGGTGGYLELRASGVFSHVSTFHKNGNAVVVYPMIHIGDREFYRRLNRYGTRDGVTLMEGVSDVPVELKHLDHRDAASFVGVSAQVDEMLKGCRRKHGRDPASFLCEGEQMRYEYADVSYKELQPVTQDFLRGISQDTFLERLMKSLRDGKNPAMSTIIDDIEDKREERLFVKVGASLEKEKLIVIPWGAAHSFRIGKRLEALGYRRDESETVSVISFRSLLGRLGSRQPPHARSVSSIQPRYGASGVNSCR